MSDEIRARLTNWGLWVAEEQINLVAKNGIWKDSGGIDPADVDDAQILEAEITRMAQESRRGDKARFAFKLAYAEGDKRLKDQAKDYGVRWRQSTSERTYLRRLRESETGLERRLVVTQFEKARNLG